MDYLLGVLTFGFDFRCLFCKICGFGLGLDFGLVVRVVHGFVGF